MMRTVVFAAALLSCAVRAAPQATPAAPQVPVVIDEGPDIHSAVYDATFYTHPTTRPESWLDTTGGIVRVRAPIAVAIDALKDFKQAIPFDATSEATVVVVAQNGSTRDVYVRVPTIIPDYWVWTVVRFEPIDEGERGFVFRGHQIDGNLGDLRIFWRLVPDGDETLARFELLGEPIFPLPRKWIMRDTMKGVVRVIENFRTALETKAPPSEH